MEKVLPYLKDKNKNILRMDYTELANKPDIFTPYVNEDGDLVMGDVGNEKWELITDIILEEDVSIVDIAKDLNQNQFSLKKVAFFQYIMASNKSGRAGLKINNIPNEVYFAPNNAMTTGTNVYSKGYIEGIRGVFVGRNIVPYNNNSSYNDSLIYETVSEENFVPITGYRWCQLNGGILKAGSTLKVWGIRA